MAGLVAFKSNAQIDSEQKTQSAAFEVQHEDSITESQLAGHIRKAWWRNRRAKQRIEDELLTCLRQRKGVYSTQQLADINENGGSDVYIKLVSTKVRAAIAWIRDIMLPVGENSWGVDPTPIAALPDWMQQNVIQKAMQSPGVDQHTGEPIPFERRRDELEDLVREMMRKHARDAMAKMESKIEDQLAEGGFRQAMSAFISEYCTYPTAILKGPIHTTRQSRIKWEMTPEGFRPIQTAEAVPSFKSVSPFDVYPSPNAETAQDGDFIERMRLSASEIYNFQGIPGYSTEAIQAVLQEHGRNGLKEWLWDDTERARLENKEYFWLKSDGTVDAIQYWGQVEGRMLLDWGVPSSRIDDPLKHYEVDAILIGRHVIRAVVRDQFTSERPYHCSSYEKIPGAFWGNSIPFLARDSETVCNSTGRAMIDNHAISSGIQAIVNYQLLSPETDPFDIYPGKVWQVGTTEYNTSQPPVEFFQPQANSSESLGIFDKFYLLADDATGVPRYAYGNEQVKGAGATARGLETLMDGAAKGIRSAIANIEEDVTQPAIRQLYDHNMLYDEDMSIKGDAQVVARGISAILIKDRRRQEYLQMLETTNNPVDLEIIGQEGRAGMLRDWASFSGRDDLVPSDEELEARNNKGEEQPPIEILKLEQEAKLAKSKLESEREKWQADLQLKREVATQPKAPTVDRDLELQKMRQEQIVASINAKGRVDAERAKGESDQEEVRIRNEADFRVETEKRKAAEQRQGFQDAIAEMAATIKELQAEGRLVESQAQSVVNKDEPTQATPALPPVINVTIDNGSPNRTVTAKCDDNGNMTAEITSGGDA